MTRSRFRVVVVVEFSDFAYDASYHIAGKPVAGKVKNGTLLRATKWGQRIAAPTEGESLSIKCKPNDPLEVVTYLLYDSGQSEPR